MSKGENMFNDHKAALERAAAAHELDPIQYPKNLRALAVEAFKADVPFMLRSRSGELRMFHCSMLGEVLMAREDAAETALLFPLEAT